MKIFPYLNFNGQCAAAFKAYEKILGGRIEMLQTHGESPMKEHVPADWQDKILHAHLVVGDEAIMGSDAPPDRYERPQGTFVSISLGADKAGPIFDALAEGGTVVMPFQKTFWSPGFGMLIDRFGTPWMVNAE